MNHRPSLRNTSLGFTMVELTLAMAFVAVLMLVIASTVIQMGSIYNKGITMKAVEQAGRFITSDIRQTVSQGKAISLKENCIYQTSANPGTSVGTLTIVNVATCIDEIPESTLAGRLCTGKYTYVWNYGDEITSKTASTAINKYSDPSSAEDKIRLIRIRDVEGFYCSLPLSDIPRADATELLSSNAVTGTDMDLAIHRFQIEEASKSNNQALYAFKMTIGTNDTDFIQTGGDCKTPNEDVQAQNFCAVNVFEFTALNDIMRSQ